MMEFPSLKECVCFRGCRWISHRLLTRTYDWSEVVAGKWLRERLEEIRSPQAVDSVYLDHELLTELRPYQKEGVAWLWLMVRLGLGACLADDMGLGKTIQVISILLLIQENRGRKQAPSLLVVPASLVANWKAEMKRFAPTLRAFYAHPSELPAAELKRMGTQDADDRLSKLDVVVTTYGQVGRLKWLKERQWKMVVLDEAQAIKNPVAQQTKHVKALKAEGSIALSGTPIENKLSDLWSIFDFLNPGLLGNSRQFKLFSKGLDSSDGRAYRGLRNLVKPYLLRRLKTDKSVIQDLPDKVEVRSHCLLSKKQAVLYQQSVVDLAEKLEEADGIQRRGLVLSFLMRFKQICNHPSQVFADNVFEPVDSGKFLRLRELGEEIASRQEKVLVFTQFKEMTRPLERHLREVFAAPGLILHGGTAVKKRRILVDAFQKEDGPPFFVLSLKAGGV
ncbi:MAG TPA: DEAD/DEAH box helicase, partial [Verrucomicrobiales bacterium]|nr:DEAD/DEAH box helicase [Verrucomicrobiales bacterium]